MKLFYVCLLAFITLIASTSCRTNHGLLYIENNFAEFGLKYNLDTTNPKYDEPSAFLQVAMPVWIDLQKENKINGLVLSPLFVYTHVLYGMQLSMFSASGEFHGLQIGSLASFSWEGSGVSIAPFIFSGGGDCILLGVFSSSDLGRGSTSVLGQLSCINYSGPTTNSSHVQFGIVNLDNSTVADESYMPYQIGLVNCSNTQKVLKDSIFHNKLQFGLINFNNKSEESIQFGILNFNENGFLPVSLLVNW